jgi:AcrR family transcriptional regulator
MVRECSQPPTPNPVNPTAPDRTAVWLPARDFTRRITTLVADPKSTQRARLLDAMVHIAVRDGYASATIAQVIAHARVSRPTFYDYFSDKDDCVLAAVAAVQQQLLDRTRRAVESMQPSQASAASIAALVEFAASEPERAHFLTNESMAGGPRALDARDRGILEIATLVEKAQAQASGYVPDIAPRVLIGAIQRLLAMRLRHGQHSMDGVLDDLLAWLESYEQPSGERRWSDLEPLVAAPAWHVPPEMLLRAPAPLTRPRSRLYEEVAENQRQRIMFATAAVAEEVGYSASTVTQITRRAGVSHRAFASLFADKQAAYLAAHELGFQRTMAFTASAFFAGESWPERVWEAERAFTQFLHLNPWIPHIGFVDAYAVGPDAVQRFEDSLRGFTVFLQEGHSYASRTTQGTSQLALEAIAACIFELCYLQTRHDRARQLANMLPHTAFLCLAPFLGTAEANRFIDAKLAATTDA